MHLLYMLAPVHFRRHVTVLYLLYNPLNSFVITNLLVIFLTALQILAALPALQIQFLALV